VRIFIDFDGTICPSHRDDTPPAPEAVQLIQQLHASGDHEIVIFSCRSNLEICQRGTEVAMVEYLAKHGIPYHRIQAGKPLYDVLIDDRALNPTHEGGWAAIAERLTT
jgi:trehalose-6-phosphatase